MGLILPAALGFSALALPIIVLYMLRLRRRPQPVSSLLLWRRVLQDRQANAPWQKIRRNLLLLLQLLILALAVLALARPFRQVEAAVQGNVIILIDASASMQATDVPPSRFVEAKLQAAALLRTLKPGSAVSIVAVADTPQPVISGEAAANRADLQAALDALRPTASAANWQAALALAAAGAASQPQTTIVIFSDGARPETEAPAMLGAPVRWMTIGQAGENQAITALAARPGPAHTELFAHVTNAAGAPAARRLELYADGQLFEARNLTLPAAPADGLSLTFTNLPTGTRVIEARLAGSDDLSLDDTAVAVLPAQTGQALLVGPGNLFLERALSLRPGLTVRQTTPGQIPADTPFDLTVFDRTAPDALPENLGNLLFIGPPQSTPLFEVRGVFSDTALAAGRPAQHPALAFVDFAGLHVARSPRIDAPWAEPLLSAQGGPLLLAGEVDNRRVAVISFDLLQSDLPLQVDFPILMANLTAWLVGQSPAEALSAPETAPVSDNPLNAAESDITPGRFQVQGAEAGQSPAGFEPGRAEFWAALAGLALLVLAVEWWVYWRGEGA